MLVGLFLVIGGLAHYFILVSTWQRQRTFIEKYIKFARRSAWGDESAIAGIPGLAEPVDTREASEEPDSTANLNRRQKRELERQQKKDKSRPSTKPVPAPVPQSTGERRRVQAENGKVLIVDRNGNVFLEEEDPEDGSTQEYFLDPEEAGPKPTIWDTAVIRLPIWLYRKAADPFLKDTKPVAETEGSSNGAIDVVAEAGPSIIGLEKQTAPDMMSSSQMSDFEIVDSTGIEKEIEKVSDGNGPKKRGKKGKK